MWGSVYISEHYFKTVNTNLSNKPNFDYDHKMTIT
jgi:hypothetical protein